MPSPSATSTIVTQAFRFMEVSPPSSLADADPKANAAKEQYPIALKACLEQEDFSFARKLVNLPSAELDDTAAQDPELKYFYAFPADLVKFRAIMDPTVKYRIEANGVRANVPAQLAVLYTFAVEEERSLPATFQIAVSYQLASLLAPTYVASRTKRADLKTDGAQALRTAIENDAVSASHARWDDQPEQGNWVHEATR